MQDATKYLKTELIDDEKQLIRAISSPLFHSLTSLGQGMWEVISLYRRVNISNLIQLSFFVYGKAKVMMLDFVYNFIDYFFPVVILSWVIQTQIAFIWPFLKQKVVIMRI